MSGDPLGILTPKKQTSNNDPLGILTTPKKEQPTVPTFMDVAGQTQQTIQTAKQNVPKPVYEKPKPTTGEKVGDIMGKYGITPPMTEQQSVVQYGGKIGESLIKQRDEAIENTIQYRNNKLGIKTDTSSVKYKNDVKKLRDQFNEGEFVKAEGKNGKQYVVPGAGFWESAGMALAESFKAPVQAWKINTLEGKDLADYLDRLQRDEPFLPQKKPSGVAGAFGETAGGFPKFAAIMSAGNAIAPMMGTGLVGAEAEFVSTAMYTRDLYQRNLQKLLDEGIPVEEARLQAADKAKKDAPVIAMPDAAMAVGLGVNLNPTRQVAAETFKKLLVKEAAHATKIGLAGGGAELAKVGTEVAMGYDVTPNEALERFADATFEWATMDAMFKVLPLMRKMPGALKASYKEYLRTIPREVIEQQAAEKNVPIEEIDAELNSYEAARSKVADIVPEESVSTFAGLTEKQDKLKSEISELESKKAVTPEGLHPQIEKEIEVRKSEIESINKQIADIAEKGNAEKIDIDRRTGEPEIKKPEEISQPIELEVETPKVETATPEQGSIDTSLVLKDEGNDSVGGNVELKKGNKIQWDVFGNEESGEWTVGEKTKTRGGKDAVVLSKVYVESSSDGKRYTKEYADANGIKYDNERIVEHIVPLEDLQSIKQPTPQVKTPIPVSEQQPTVSTETTATEVEQPIKQEKVKVEKSNVLTLKDFDEEGDLTDEGFEKATNILSNIINNVAQKYNIPNEQLLSHYNIKNGEYRSSLKGIMDMGESQDYGKTIKLVKDIAFKMFPDKIDELNEQINIHSDELLNALENDTPFEVNKSIGKVVQALNEIDNTWNEAKKTQQESLVETIPSITPTTTETLPLSESVETAIPVSEQKETTPQPQVVAEETITPNEQEITVSKEPLPTEQQTTVLNVPESAFELFENEGQWKAATSTYKGRDIGNFVYSFLDKKQKREYDKIREKTDGKFGTKEQAEENLKLLQNFENKNKEAFDKAKQAIDEIPIVKDTTTKEQAKEAYAKAIEILGRKPIQKQQTTVSESEATPITETPKVESKEVTTQQPDITVTEPTTTQPIVEEVKSGAVGVGNWREKYKEADAYRKSDILRAIAEVSKSDKELSDVLDMLVKGAPNESNVAWEVANNPNSSKETFKKAVSNKALIKSTTDENIQSLREKRFGKEGSVSKGVKTETVTEKTKTDLGTKARDLAAKVRSGEKQVLPDWLQASLPKGTKKQGIDINEAFAKALETFADIYDTTKDFAQAVEQGFKNIKNWFEENNIPYNETELKQKFAEDRQAATEETQTPPTPPIPPVSEGKEKSGESGTDERRFTKQMLETPEMLPEAKGEIAETLKYAVQTNAMSSAQASEIIKKVGLDEAFALVMDRNNDMNGGVRVVMAQAIIKSYNELATNAPDQATKDFYLDKTISVAKDVTEKLATDPGQMIQSFSLWSRLSPEGQIRAAAKEVGEIGEQRKAKRKKDINNIGNKFKKANEEAADEVTKDAEVAGTINKSDNERIKKAKVKIAKAKKRRENLINKYKQDKGKKLFSTVPGLTPEGIEFVGEVALTYIQEGVANVEILVEKIKQHLKEVSGNDVPDELTQQITDIADKRLNNEDLRLIGQELKEQKLVINNIIKQHFTVAEAAKKSLADKLIEKAGLTGQEAADLAAKVEAAFDRIATRKKKRILFQEKARFDRIKNGMKGANTVDPKTLQGEMIRYSNLGAFDNDAFADMIAEKLGTGKLTPQEAQKIIELSDRVQKAPEGSPKNDATEDLLSYRAKLKGTSWGEISQGVWYANVLSGYKTHEKNIVSTFFNVISELSAQSLKNPKEAPFILYGFLKGARRGALEGIHTFATGRSPIHVKKIETPNILERQEFIGGKFNPANWLKFVTRAMVAEDVLMFQGLKEARAYQLALREAKKYGAKKGEIWKAVDELLLNTKERYDEAVAQAKSEGLKSTIDIKRRVYELMESSRPVEMTEDAYGFAAEGTFNHETQGTLGALSNGISALIDVPVGGTQPLRFLVPFTRIITNVVNQALNYTPVGFIRAARGVRGFKSFEKYAYAKSAYIKLTPDQRKTLIAKASLGMGLAAAIYALSKMKDDDDEPILEITGGGTGDYKKDQQLRESGWQEYSLKIGDTYWSYKLTPLVFMLGFFGNMNDKEKYAKTDDDATTIKQMELAMWRNFELVGEMSWINSAGTLLGALQEGVKNKEDIVRSLEQSVKGFVVPQAYTQAAQEVQNIFNLPQKRVDNMWQNMIQDIPIARNSLNDKINALGDPIIRDVDVISSEETKDPVWKFLLSNNGWVAPVNKNSMTVFDSKTNKERDITDDEYYNFSKLRGQLLKEKIRNLMNKDLVDVENLEVFELEKGTAQYRKMLQKELRKLSNDATNEAKEQLMPKDLMIQIIEDIDTELENIYNR